MTLRHRLLATTAFAGLAIVTLTPARAGLIGVGGTVQAQFDFVLPNVGAGVEPEANQATATTAAAALTAPVTFSQGADDGSTITVSNTQITITNNLTIPFCFGTGVGNSCNDPYDTFLFRSAAQAH